MKTCKKCDLQYDDSKKFCKQCGAPLEGEIKIESKAEAKKQVFEEKLKTDPLNVKLLHEYGQFLYENKLFKEAVAICLKIIAIDESDNRAKELLFNAYLNIGEFAKAAETGEELYKPKSRDVIFLLLLANAHQQAGASPRAVEIYDQVVALQPDNTEAAYQKALALLSENKAEAAMPIFGRLFADGKTDRITSVYAGIEKAVNEDHKAAIEILTPVLSEKDTQLNDLDNNRGFVYLAYSLCKTTADVQAIEKWSNLIDLSVLEEQHNSMDEIIVAQAIVMLFEHQLNLLQSKGERYEIQQRINEYIKNSNSYFTEASRPVFALAWYAAAEKQESFGFYDDVIESMKRCVELAPDKKEYSNKLDELTKVLAAINSKKKKRKVITWSVIIAIIAIAAGAYFGYQRFQDNKVWSAAKKIDTYDSYISYLKQNPKGRYVDRAKNKLVFEDSRDSFQYKIIQIGDQMWMAENLNADKFRNGDPITHAQTNEEWLQAGKNRHPVWCYYNNDPDNEKIFGKLYNWYAVSDPRGLAPEGWQIPTNEDWEKLIENSGGNDRAGGKLKAKGTRFWENSNKGATNETGFSALPGGLRDRNGSFILFGKYGFWWTSTEGNPDCGIYHVMEYNSTSMEKNYIKGELINDYIFGSNPHPIIIRSFSDPKSNSFDPENVKIFLKYIEQQPRDIRLKYLQAEADIINQKHPNDALSVRCIKIRIEQ